MSSMNGSGCANCGELFRDGEDYRDHLPCENAVQRAVREEREAVVVYIRGYMGEDDSSTICKALAHVLAGDHRK